MISTFAIGDRVTPRVDFVGFIPSRLEGEYIITSCADWGNEYMVNGCGWHAFTDWLLLERATPKTRELAYQVNNDTDEDYD